MKNPALRELYVRYCFEIAFYAEFSKDIRTSLKYESVFNNKLKIHSDIK